MQFLSSDLGLKKYFVQLSSGIIPLDSLRYYYEFKTYSDYYIFADPAKLKLSEDFIMRHFLAGMLLKHVSSTIFCINNVFLHLSTQGFLNPKKMFTLEIGI